MNTVLETEDLEVVFGGLHAVDKVTIALEAGKLYGLIGPNGSGKSTMLGAVSGLTRTSGGAIRFAGEDCIGASPARMSRLGLARTFQTVRLVHSLTVRENVMMGADASVGSAGRLSGLVPWGGRRREHEIRDLAGAALDRLGVASLGDQYPRGLPYGFQRRVEIARAIVGRPKLLLLDEPAAGMNRSERDEIGDLFQKLCAEGLTQLLVEHDLRMMETVCQHVFVLNTGRLIAEGTPEAVVANPEVQTAYIGREADVAIGGI